MTFMTNYNLGKVNKQLGMTLIEILVAVFILAVGLLGLASLQVNGLRSNQSAYLRSQASLMAADMADRMRLNSAKAIGGSYDGFSTANGATNPNCSTTATGCSESAQVLTDKAEWSQAINGSTGGIALLPSGTGTITRGAGNLFTITIQWQETNWDEASGTQSDQTQDFTMNFSL